MPQFEHLIVGKKPISIVAIFYIHRGVIDFSGLTAPVSSLHELFAGDVGFEVAKTEEQERFLEGIPLTTQNGMDWEIGGS